MYIYANSSNKQIIGVTLHDPGVKHSSSLWFKGSCLLVPSVDSSADFKGWDGKEVWCISYL